MSGFNTGAVLDGQVTHRGSSNTNDRGSSYTRRRRREWLRQLPDQARNSRNAGVRPVEVTTGPTWRHCSQDPAAQCKGNNGCPCGDAVRAEVQAAGYEVRP